MIRYLANTLALLAKKIIAEPDMLGEVKLQRIYFKQNN